MKVLIVGGKGQGKTTLSNIMANKKLCKFKDSTLVLCKELFHHFEDRYESYKDLHKAKDSHRKELQELLQDYVKDDKTKFIRKAANASYGYVGLRDFDQLISAIEEELFTHIIWIERKGYRHNDATLQFSFSDLYEEYLREDTRFSLAKVTNYSEEWLERLCENKMKKFLDKSNSFAFFA